MWLGGASEGRAVARSTSYSGAGAVSSAGEEAEERGQRPGLRAGGRPEPISTISWEERGGQRAERGGRGRGRVTWWPWVASGEVTAVLSPV